MPPSSVVHGKLKWYVRHWSYLDEGRDVATYSPTMACGGHNWKIALYPGGNPGSAPPEKEVTAMSSVAIYLHYEGCRDEGAFGLEGSAKEDVMVSRCYKNPWCRSKQALIYPHSTRNTDAISRHRQGWKRSFGHRRSDRRC